MHIWFRDVTEQFAKGLLLRNGKLPQTIGCLKSCNAVGQLNETHTQTFLPEPARSRVRWPALRWYAGLRREAPCLVGLLANRVTIGQA